MLPYNQLAERLPYCTTGLQCTHVIKLRQPMLRCSASPHRSLRTCSDHALVSGDQTPEFTQQRYHTSAGHDVDSVQPLCLVMHLSDCLYVSCTLSQQMCLPMQSTCSIQVHAGYRSVCEVRNAPHSLLLTCQHWDPAEGGFPESTCAAVPLAQEHPWEWCIQGKHSVLEHCQTPDHGTISPLSGRSSWDLRTHSLLVCMSCKFKK